MMAFLDRFRSSITVGAVLCLAMAVGGCAVFDDDGDTGESGQALAGDGAGDDGSESETVCGREVLPSPASVPAKPCYDGELVVDETVERTRGKPDESTTIFQLDESSQLCLQFDNIAGATPTGADGDRSNGEGEGDGRGKGNGKGNGKGKNDGGDERDEAADGDENGNEEARLSA
ncbi:MAG: hypothetical protein ABEN55_16670, partial [Bradymonadaceae bacterium]